MTDGKSTEIAPANDAASMPLNQPACGNCRFWRMDLENGQTNVGFCRLKPPNLYLFPHMTGPGKMAMQEVTAFPKTQAKNWCGGHVSRIPANVGAPT